jgi:hypothetical protein
MDKPNVPVPPREDVEQVSSSTAANPAPNVPFAMVDQNFAAMQQLLNPYAAAVAAIALGNQQMTQSIQPNMAVSSQQPNVAFGAPAAAQQTAASSGTNSATASNSSQASANNVISAPNVPASIYPLQQLVFPFPAAQANPFAAALLAGGALLPGIVATPATAALAAAQPNNVQQQQQLANNNTAVFNATSAPARAASEPKKKKRSPPKKTRAGTQHQQQQQQHVPGAAVAAAAAAQVVAAHHAAAATTNGVMANAMFAHMQNWKLDQLGKNYACDIDVDCDSHSLTILLLPLLLVQRPMFNCCVIPVSQYLNPSHSCWPMHGARKRSERPSVPPIASRPVLPELAKRHWWKK